MSEPIYDQRDEALTTAREALEEVRSAILLTGDLVNTVDDAIAAIDALKEEPK